MRNLTLFLLASAALIAQDTRQATGVKVGEVSDTSAIVWMRVTASAARNADGSAPGAPGRVRVRYSPRRDMESPLSTPWVQVRAERDYSHQFRLEQLTPATRYYYSAETEGYKPLLGTFATAPRRNAAEEVKFTVVTGMANRDLDHADGFHIFEAMRKLAPDFIVFTGDTVYYDSDPPIANSVQLARYHWDRMFSLPRHIAFLLRVPAYFIKDDHDTYHDDCWPGMQAPKVAPMTFERGRTLFLEEVPMGDRTWRSARWGKHLQIWLPEGRDFRSPNPMPDGPNKTIWGPEQKAWIKKSMLESDADWRLIVSPTPIVGPDRIKKGDNHANLSFQHEGDEIRRWIRDNGGKNTFVACGDRHWQYHSVHPETGVQEFSCGPASDKHADGSPGENPEYHRFHRVKGGFLSVTANSGGITFRHHDVHGAVVYETSFKRQ